MNFSLTLPVGGLKKPMFRHIQIINSWWYIPLYPETSFRYGSLMLVISSIIIIIQDVQPSTVTPQKIEHISITVLVGVFFLFFTNHWPTSFIQYIILYNIYISMI
jgi:hypothetical protein